MSKQGPSSGRGARVSGSVITGLLLVPATAIAAVAIVGMTARPPAAEASEEITTTTEQVEEEAIEAVAVDLDSLSDDEALEEACTESAEELVERELDGSISDIEMAALDALRQICEEHGIPIAGPPEAEPIVQVITVKADSQDSTDDDAGDHAEYDDDDDDDDDDEDDEDDHEDEEDDEDEEDEKDD